MRPMHRIIRLGDGGGAVDPASAVSDAKGEIKAKWTLGPSVPAQTLFASTPGVNAVQLTALAILPADVSIAQGNNQSAKVGTTLANSIVIRVVGTGPGINQATVTVSTLNTVTLIATGTPWVTSAAIPLLERRRVLLFDGESEAGALSDHLADVVRQFKARDFDPHIIDVKSPASTNELNRELSSGRVRFSQ